MNIRRDLRLSVVAIVAAVMVECTMGEAVDEVRRIPEVVVTATRMSEEVHDLPYMTESIGSSDIQNRRQSRTTPEILREEPSVMVQKTSHGQGSPFIRGFTGFRTLFLVDGIRLNNSTFRDGPNQYWNTVDSFSFDRLEIVKGPSSVLYGSDAVGGTVNALSMSPFDREATDKGVGGRTLYRYSSAEDSHTIRAEGHAVHEKVGVQAGISYRDYGDLRSGSGRQPKTGYDDTSFDARADYRITPDVRLVLAHQTVEQNDAWRTHRTIYGRSFEGTTVGSEKKRILDQDRHLTYLRLEAAEMTGFMDELNATVSHHHQGERQQVVKKDDTGSQQDFDVNTLGLSAQASSRSEVGEWIYGFEYYRDYVDSSGRDYNADGSLKKARIQGPVADDSTYDTLGVYLQNKIVVASRTDLVLGGRYNRFDADARAFEDPVNGKRTSLEKNWDALVGSARVLHRLFPDAGVNMFAGVSQGFRAPNLSDLTRLDSARTDELETAAPDLDPERYLAYEIGLKIATGIFNAECAYFYTDIEDMIIRTPTGRVLEDGNEVTKKNAGEGYVQGIELSGSVQIVEDWLLWGNITWMDGKVDTYPTSSMQKEREPVDRLMPLTANTGIRYQPTSRYWIEAYLTAAERKGDLSTAEKADTQRIPPGETPGYTVFSCRGGFKLTEALSISAALENIADKDYRVHGSGLNEAGRNLIVSTEYVF